LYTVDRQRAPTVGPAAAAAATATDDDDADDSGAQ